MALSEAERAERRKATSRKYYLKNRERILKETGERQRANPARRREYVNAWAKRNADSERERARLKNWRVNNLPAPTRPEPEVCECCGKPNIRGDGRRALALDHCHDSGRFRGWLCDACNLGIGKLGDSVEAVERALAYLRRNESA